MGCIGSKSCESSGTIASASTTKSMDLVRRPLVMTQVSKSSNVRTFPLHHEGIALEVQIHPHGDTYFFETQHDSESVHKMVSLWVCNRMPFELKYQVLEMGVMLHNGQTHPLHTMTQTTYSRPGHLCGHSKAMHANDLTCPEWYDAARDCITFYVTVSCSAVCADTPLDLGTVLLHDDTRHDCVLVSNTWKMGAHAAVLAARSSYARAQLTHPLLTNVVTLYMDPSVSIAACLQLLCYLYTGRLATTAQWNPRVWEQPQLGCEPLGCEPLGCEPLEPLLPSTALSISDANVRSTSTSFEGKKQEGMIDVPGSRRILYAPPLRLEEWLDLLVLAHQWEVNGLVYTCVSWLQKQSEWTLVQAQQCLRVAEQLKLHSLHRFAETKVIKHNISALQQKLERI